MMVSKRDRQQSNTCGSETLVNERTPLNSGYQSCSHPTISNWQTGDRQILTLAAFFFLFIFSSITGYSFDGVLNAERHKSTRQAWGREEKRHLADQVRWAAEIRRHEALRNDMDHEVERWTDQRRKWAEDDAERWETEHQRTETERKRKEKEERARIERERRRKEEEDGERIEREGRRKEWEHERKVEEEREQIERERRRMRWSDQRQEEQEQERVERERRLMRWEHQRQEEEKQEQIDRQRRRKEWERQRKEEEEHGRITLTWEEMKASDRCLQYGTREYQAKLGNIALGLDPMQECTRKPALIHGKEVLPHRCTHEGVCGAVYGHWIIDFKEDGCMPTWGALADKGCVEPGIRRWESRLWNLNANDDWFEMCSSTPAIISGVALNGPTDCVDYGLIYGKWGTWMIPDPNCNLLQGPMDAVSPQDIILDKTQRS